MFLLLYIIITTHQIENLKLVDFIACKLYSNKTGLKMREVMRINMFLAKLVIGFNLIKNEEPTLPYDT